MRREQRLRNGLRGERIGGDANGLVGFGNGLNHQIRRPHIRRKGNLDGSRAEIGGVFVGGRCWRRVQQAGER